MAGRPDLSRCRPYLCHFLKALYGKQQKWSQRIFRGLPQSAAGNLGYFFSPFDEGAISIEGTCLAFRGRSGVPSLPPTAFRPFISGSSSVPPSCPPAGFMVSCIFRFNVAGSSFSRLISASLGHEAATISRRIGMSFDSSAFSFPLSLSWRECVPAH